MLAGQSGSSAHQPLVNTSWDAELSGALPSNRHAAFACSLCGRAFCSTQPPSSSPTLPAESIAAPLPRTAAKIFAGYRQSLQPRLLVLPGLIAAAAAWNAAFPEAQLGLVEQACLLAGFCSWKVRGCSC